MNSTNRFDFLNYETKNLFPIGLSTFDNLIGGGFPATSINLIEEDCYQQYSTMLLKALISNGIMNDETIIIFSEDITSKNNRFIKELPTLQSSTNTSFVDNEPDMKIAFRYANLPSRFSSDQIGEDTSTEKFDFGAHLIDEIIKKAKIEFYKHDQICDILFKMTQDKPKGRFRIVIHKLGSIYSPILSTDILKTAFKIKVLMRKLKNTFCLMTLLGTEPENEADLSVLNTAFRNQLYHICDSALKLVSFSDDGDDKNAYSSDYVGIIQILKVQQLNSFTPFKKNLESNEYGLKLRNSKRHLNVEKLSLPPDLGETVSRFTNSNETKLPCSSGISF